MNNMTPTENLFYALGELAFSIAASDGLVQKEEREKFRDIITGKLKSDNYSFNVSDIIFQILDKSKYKDAQSTYDGAIKQIRQNSHYLSPQLKESFIMVMEGVAQAFPPVTISEKNLIDQFKNDIAPLIGDPVFYNSIHRKH